MKISYVALCLALSFSPVALTGCSSDSDGTSTDAAATADSTAAASIANNGVRLVSAEEAQALAADPTVSIIDVRTADEFAQGHIANASEIDFYATDFRTKLEALDRNGHYLIYCHSGNRSGQARTLMAELGFSDVADLDGGITAWTAAGKPVAQ